MQPGQARSRLLQQAQEWQAALQAGGDAADPVELDQTRVGRLSRMDAMQQQALAQAARARAQQGLQRVRAALSRLDAGDYGYCLDCGDEIADARLQVDPAAERCLACAQAQES